MIAIVKDSFEIKSSYNTGHSQGVVAVLDRIILPDTQSLIGVWVRIIRNDGDSLDLQISDAREHGSVQSICFETELSNIPIGTTIRFSGNNAE